MVGPLMVLAVSSAWAGGGRIGFTGAVVEPTCAIDSVPVESVGAQSWQARQAPSRRSCGRTAVDLGRSYSRAVIVLDAANTANDRLLSYFVSYAPLADGDMAAKLVVRTYD
jgi:hypothetical protein